jgi:hypothetical protein
MTAGLVGADSSRTISFVSTISPPSTAGFDISFVKHDVHAYVLADSANQQIDLFDAAVPSFTGAIGAGAFTGRPATCAILRGCNGPNGVLIDGQDRVWAGNGDGHVLAYTLTVGSGTTGQIANLATGGKFRADELSFDPRGAYILVANDDEGFLTLIKTVDTPSVVDHFYYSDNTLGQPPSQGNALKTDGGIEQSLWWAKSGLFYQAVPAGSGPGRVDIFDPTAGHLQYVKSFVVSACSGGPTGFAVDESNQALGACQNGTALVNLDNGAVTMIGTAATTGGADELWFDSGSDAWYLGISGGGGKLGVVVDDAAHTILDETGHGGGHSVAAYTVGHQDNGEGVRSPQGNAHNDTNKSLIFQPCSTTCPATKGVNVWQSTVP